MGMHLYQNDDEDDDVSVLTFHTMGTKEFAAVGSVGSNNNSSFVKSAREAMERLVSESKNSGGAGEDDGKSLSRISEEGGSQVSSSCHSSKRGCDRSKPSSMKSDEKDTALNEDNYYGDDDTISLTESILDSASKVLSNIEASPFYVGKSKNHLSSMAHYDTPPPQPNPKHPSPMKRPNKKSMDVASSEKINGHDYQLEISSTFLSSYFCDENAKPSSTNHQSDHSKENSSSGCGKHSNDEQMQKLESETKELHVLLKERQLKTKRASQSLGSSIKKANELLERISGDRMSRG